MIRFIDNESSGRELDTPKSEMSDGKYFGCHFGASGLIYSMRRIRVYTGSAEIFDLGTEFDVRLERGSTVVTVVEGRVAVGPSRMLERLGTNSNQNHAPRFVQLSADERILVTEGEWPATRMAVDAQRTTA